MVKTTRNKNIWMEFRFVVDNNAVPCPGSKTKALGPRDRRLLRSRCDECARSHKQCSGGVVCSNCSRLGQKCIYSNTRQAVVKYGKGSSCSAKVHPLLVDRLVLPDTLHDPASTAIDYFFQQFVPANNFSGQSSTYMYDIHLYSQSCPQVYHAATAIGAQSIRRCSATQSPAWSRLAYESYECSLKTLYSRLRTKGSSEDQLQILWTILLLGIFELMEDRTGQGFLRHMNLGAAQVLEYLGPAFFRDGLARRFFLEMRLLEVSKCILLSQPSLFAQQNWRELRARIAQGEETTPGYLIEELLDVMACSPDFVVRAIRTAEEAASNGAIAASTLEALSHKASELFDRLRTWFRDNHQREIISQQDETALLCSLYCSAISIYISSPFDYFTIWQASGIPVPSLTQAEVEGHVENIVLSTKQLLKSRSVAGVLLLFPLRIAGSRSRFDPSPARREEIKNLLEQISRTYAVSEAVIGDLKGLWDSCEVQLSRQRK